ncbi:MAG TPA: FtsX-like permease family protein [Actinocatenispora sp.]
MFRAVLKSLLARKLRLVLSGLAVVLGVMFVAGALVLTTSLGNSFQGLFSTVYQNVDVQVAPKPAPGQGQQTGPSAVGATLPASLVGTVSAVDGVKSAHGEVMTNGVIPLDRRGKAVPSTTGQQYGSNWRGDNDVVQLRTGHGPTRADEVVINAGLAKTGDFRVGDPIKVITNGKTNRFTIVGTYGYSGNRDSLGGETDIAFTTPVAQKLLLGRVGVYSSVSVTADKGVSQSTLKDRVSGAVGHSYEVQTGDALAKKATDSIKEGLKFLNYVLLGFAGVALFVGAFLILNTFSIIVAQRTRELALMRAIGASRRQMIGSVLLEAVVIGIVAGGLGLLAGIGIGALLGYVFTHVGGGNLELSIGVPASAVAASFAVGIVITVVAALFPSLRASRIPPVAAMRDAATPDRPLTRVTVAGAIVFVLGGGLLGLGLFGSLSGTGTLWAILGGVLVAFIGVALLTPVISKPVVGVIGRLLSFSTAGKLGRRNSSRNPRRTAITAAALMVGIALITGVSTVLSSVQTSIDKIANQQIKADLIVAGQQTSEVPPTFDPALLPKMRDVSGVSSVAGIYSDRGQVDGKTVGLTATDDVAALTTATSMTRHAGTITSLRGHQVLLDEKTAKADHLDVGDTVRIQLTHGAATYTLTGIYSSGEGGMSGWLLPASSVRDFALTSPTSAFVTVADGASTTTAKKQIDDLLADNPLVTVADRSDFIDQQTSTFDTVQTMIQVLLTLAIIIAALGVVNTLALSVIERTRELGLLRAIGMKRRQVMGMITVESVTISVFGAVLGLVVGIGLGAAVVRALHDQGIKYLSFSWGLMVAYLVLAAVIGVLAAILPSIRAARLNVLGAIAYE